MDGQTVCIDTVWYGWEYAVYIVKNLSGFTFHRQARQGSVATCFRCGGIFNDRCIANLLVHVVVKKF